MSAKIYQVHRKFSKVKYTYSGTRRLKRHATKDAKRWRKQGRNVRIVKVKPFGKPYYNLYVREKNWRK